MKLIPGKRACFIVFYAYPCGSVLWVIVARAFSACSEVVLQGFGMVTASAVCRVFRFRLVSFIFVKPVVCIEGL